MAKYLAWRIKKLRIVYVSSIKNRKRVNDEIRIVLHLILGSICSYAKMFNFVKVYRRHAIYAETSKLRNIQRMINIKPGLGTGLKSKKNDIPSFFNLHRPNFLALVSKFNLCPIY